ncbi:arginase [Bergeyella sp. RCAD1439]|uniref:arginase n=1 Tax=Bergeyella anatis TaxID=3113737 RepID=UPI002E16E183|nr:arginase [Bergeyella sp. RCAD1439]
MNFEDFMVPPQRKRYEHWQLGQMVRGGIPEGGIVLIWLSDQRGAGGTAEIKPMAAVRRLFYELSKADFEVPMGDLGDLISGKTLEDTHYVLQEVLLACHQRGAIPVVIGGGSDFGYSLFSALNQDVKDLTYTNLAGRFFLEQEETFPLNEKNYLYRLFCSKDFSIKNFHLLGCQKHLNDEESLNLVKQVAFDVVRLADMMHSTEKTEPYFRQADLVTVDCNAVESFSSPFSLEPQVNGLNRREICAYMKEVGMSERLKSVGIFNFNFETEEVLNRQLLAQMLWYLVEGINIRRSHPKEKEYETFWVMIGEDSYAFRREIFTNLWYFGERECPDDWLACSYEDYQNAKRGILGRRLLKFLEE